MSIFKRKKKVVKPKLRDKNPNKVLKVWNNYRLVVEETPLLSVSTPFDPKKQIQIGWSKNLILEEKVINAMSEPYFNTLCIANEWCTCSYQILFAILKEEYLKNE